MAGVELATAYVSLVVDGSKVAPGVRRSLAGTEAEAGRVGQRSGKALGDNMTKGVAASAQRMAAGIGVAFAAVGAVSFLKTAIAEGREAQKVGALTASTIKATGGAANVTAAQVGKLATALSNKTGIDDEVIQSGQNMLLTFKNVRNEAGKGNDVFNQATKALIDMSSAMGTEPRQAAIQLGKALNDPIKGISALSRVGVTFTEQQKAQIKTMVASGDAMGAQKVILAELNSEFGGAAAAQATAGEKLRVAIGNLEESVGTALIPILDKAATFLTDQAIPAFINTGHAIGSLPGPVKAAAAAWAIYTIAQKAGITSSIGNGVASLSSAMLGLRIRTLLAADAFKVARAGQINLVGNSGTFTAPLGRAAAAMTALGTASVGAGTALKKGLSGALGVVGGPWGLAFIAATVVGAHFFNAQQKSKQAVDALTASLDQQTGALTAQSHAAIFKALEDAGGIAAAKKLGLNLREVQLAAEGNTPAFKAVNAQLDEWIRNDSHVALGTKGAVAGTHARGEAARTLRDAIGDQNAAVKDSRAALTDQVAALGTAKAATDGHATSLKDDAAAAKKAATALQSYLDKLSKQRDAALAASGGAIAYQAALDAARKSLKDNGRTLDITTEKGRNNQSALDSIAGAWNDLTDKQQGAKGAFAAARTSLVNQAIAFGDTRKEAERYARKVLDIPKKISTKAILDDAAAKAKLAALTKKRQVQIQAFVDQTGRLPGQHGGPIMRAGGGPVTRGVPYIVGEHRPELFIPDQSGRIVPKVPAAIAGGNTYHTTVVADDPWAWKREMDHMTRAEALGGADFRA